jgi:hypothetical protein
VARPADDPPLEPPRTQDAPPVARRLDVGWALAMAGAAGAVLIHLPRLTDSAPDDLSDYLGAGAFTVPVALALLLSCWLLRRHGPLVAVAALAFVVSVLTAFRGGFPVALALGLVLLAAAGLRAAVRD